MSVRIVTDSTAYLSPDIVQELGVTVVPCHIQIGARTYLDGVDLDEATFAHLAYEQGLGVSTEPPTVEDFLEVYKDLNRDSADIISIHVSGALSETVENAAQAAGGLLGRCQISVIDAQTVSIGLGILVESAARAAAAGQSADDIVRLIRGLIPRSMWCSLPRTWTTWKRAAALGTHRRSWARCWGSSLSSRWRRVTSCLWKRCALATRRSKS